VAGEKLFFPLSKQTEHEQCDPGRGSHRPDSSPEALAGHEAAHDEAQSLEKPDSACRKEQDAKYD